MTLVNQTISHYKIVSLLGEGGMGEVYRARDSKLGRDVAIKVLPAAFSADAERLRRFEQEAQAAGALNHPNILVIFHIGTHESAPYIVSELLEGETLRERIAGAALPQRKAIDYALQTAHGLAAAHAKGIVHRDLKPENLFVTNDGRIKILDFGLAKLIGTGDGTQSQTEVPTRKVNTNPGTVMGTMGYMSPEQLKGQRAAVGLLDADLRVSDIWTLDLSRGNKSRLTFDPRSDGDPVWSPDGTQIVFTSNRKGDGHDHLYLTSATAAGNDQPLLASGENDDYGTSWSRDGQSILLARSSQGHTSVWLLPLSGDRQPKPLMQSAAFNEASAKFSPDGRFVAYMSDESGRPEIYVQPFPPSGTKWQVSYGGGSYPLWRGDGKELFYMTNDGKIVSAQINSDAPFQPAAPQQLFQSNVKFVPGFPYAVSPDGQRFLINTPAEANNPAPMIVVLNWTALLKK